MFSKIDSQAHAANLASLFVDRLSNNLYASALVNITNIGTPPPKTMTRIDDMAEIQALIDRYNAEFTAHTAESSR
ncbi:MAG: hypothetical protein ABI905_08550 [Betaproteobacteria bacterium]